MKNVQEIDDETQTLRSKLAHHDTTVSAVKAEHAAQLIAHREQLAFMSHERSKIASELGRLKKARMQAVEHEEMEAKKKLEAEALEAKRLETVAALTPMIRNLIATEKGAI